MNATKTRQVKTKAKEMFIEWLGNHLSEEERNKISIKDIDSLLPEQTHIYANNKLIHMSFSFKWFVKYIKRLIKKKDLKQITLKDILKDARVQET